MSNKLWVVGLVPGTKRDVWTWALCPEHRMNHPAGPCGNVDRDEGRMSYIRCKACGVAMIDWFSEAEQ